MAISEDDLRLIRDFLVAPAADRYASLLQSAATEEAVWILRNGNLVARVAVPDDTEDASPGGVGLRCRRLMLAP